MNQPPAAMRALAIAIAVISLATAILAIAWATSWPLVAVVLVASTLAFAPRWGYLFAGVLSLVLVFAGVLGTLLLSARLSIGIPVAIGIVFGLMGLAAAALLWRVEPASLRRGRDTWLTLAAASFGLVVWLVALAGSFRVPHSERLGWLMRNDSMNNLILSHVILRDSGVVLGPNVNPVPLPAALVALGMIPGRPSGGPELALAHDLASMGWTWAALIGLLSVLAGLTVAAIVRATTSSRLAGMLGALGGSVLVLSWYLTGYPIEFGFLNLDVALPVLLVSFLLAFLAARSPLVATGGLALAATLILATWSPLVLVPLALLGVTALRHRRALWPRRVLSRVLLVLAAVQLALYALFGALPSFVSQGSALGSNGGIYNQNNAIVFAAGLAVLLVAFVVYRRQLGALIVPAALVIAGWLALGVLLFLNRKNASVWTYYPVKLAYFSTVLFLIIGFGLAVAVVAQYASRPVIRWGGSVLLTVVVVGVVVFTPGSEPGIAHLNPVVRVASSHQDETLARQESLVLAVAGQGSPAVVWGTGLAYESQVDLWLVQLHDDTLSGTSRLRLAAYAQNQTGHTLDQLCGIARMIGPKLVVHTTDSSLPTKFAASCSGALVVFAALPKN